MMTLPSMLWFCLDPTEVEIPLQGMLTDGCERASCASPTSPDESLAQSRQLAHSQRHSLRSLVSNPPRHQVHRPAATMTTGKVGSTPSEPHYQP